MVRINVISKDNGVGLTADFLILQSAIKADWFFIDYFDPNAPTRNADVNIFLELLHDRYFKLAPRNILIPNPEWFATEWYSIMGGVSEVWAKTHDCEKIFKEHHSNVIYTSFTSVDKNNGNTRKSKNFLHAAGKSGTKGTKQVLNAFRGRDEQLILISERSDINALTSNIIPFKRLTEEDLNRYQNECLFHICTSQYEGFGHYLHEGKSCGIVLTTNAAPMNEFINDPDLLVNATYTQRLNQGKLFTIDPVDLRRKVKALMQMDNDTLMDKLEYCRQSWEDNDSYFRNKIKELI